LVLEILNLQGVMEDKGLDYTGYKEISVSIVILTPCAKATFCSKFNAQKTYESFGDGRKSVPSCKQKAANGSHHGSSAFISSNLSSSRRGSREGFKFGAVLGYRFETRVGWLG
jgi:hypothetical protein